MPKLISVVRGMLEKLIKFFSKKVLKRNLTEKKLALILIMLYYINVLSKRIFAEKYENLQVKIQRYRCYYR